MNRKQQPFSSTEVVLYALGAACILQFSAWPPSFAFVVVAGAAFALAIVIGVEVFDAIGRMFGL